MAASRTRRERRGGGPEVVRTRVLALLQSRWDRRLTTVVAGAGFGKSTAIAQAMRANKVSPRGVEVRVSCRFGCETPDRLVASVAEGLGVELPAGTSPLGRMQAAITDQAPVPVVVIVDDSELLPKSVAELLEQLVQSAPTNLHLVLVGRRSPAIPLARLRAAGEVFDITADDLRFDANETAALAAAFGVEIAPDAMGGWPALIRLALAAPDRAAGAFLWEEVISALSPADRSALRALCAIGSATPDEVRSLTGEPFDVDGFCERVPLVGHDGDWLVAHELWRPFLVDLGAAASLPALTERALEIVRARGDVVATGQLAIRLGDGRALRRAAVELVRTSLGSLPRGIAHAWLEAGCTDADGSPEMALLQCALAHDLVASDPPASDLDAVMVRFRELGAAADEAVAIALAALAADANRDLPRLLALSVRAREVAAVHPDPILELLVDGVEGAAAILQGDLDGALSRFDRPRPGLPIGLRPEAITRLHWHALLLAGRAGDAAALVAPFEPAAAVATPRPLESVARWLDGDSQVFNIGSVELGPDRYDQLSERDQFDQASFVAVMAAATGDTGPVDLAVDVLTSSPFGAETGPDGAVVTVARAAQRCVHHDDAGAAEEIEQFLERSPLDPLTDAYLRRSLAVPYVCASRLRTAWDAMELGPSQSMARSIARALIDARAGKCREAPEPLQAVTTVLPLPWAVELASRATAAGSSWGIELATALADRSGSATEAELNRAAEASDAVVSRGAAKVREALPQAPPAGIELALLGPLTIRRDGEAVDAPQLRRARVRELLSVLVVERSLTRDRAVELLWPDSDPAKGRANLRVTLAHLQDLLEPGRPSRSAPYFLRANPSRLELASVPGLDVDVWAIERSLAEADVARYEGDSAGRRERLREVMECWRARSLPDLDAMPDLEPTATALERRLLDACLALGELELVADRADAATRCAERALIADPYDERAHRLAIAANVHRRDRSATAAAVARLRRTMAELGVDPDDSSEMLVRQAAKAGFT